MIFSCNFVLKKMISVFFSLMLNDFFWLDFLLDFFILAHTSKLLFCKSLLSFCLFGSEMSLDGAI